MTLLETDQTEQSGDLTKNPVIILAELQGSCLQKVTPQTEAFPQ